jgi:hypothetical protein
MVGIAFQQVALDTLGRLAGDLRPAGVVEENGRPIEGGKLASDSNYIKRHSRLLILITLTPRDLINLVVLVLWQIPCHPKMAVVPASHCIFGGGSILLD